MSTKGHFAFGVLRRYLKKREVRKFQTRVIP